MSRGESLGNRVTTYRLTGGDDAQPRIRIYSHSVQYIRNRLPSMFHMFPQATQYSKILFSDFPNLLEARFAGDGFPCLVRKGRDGLLSMRESYVLSGNPQELRPSNSGETRLFLEFPSRASSLFVEGAGPPDRQKRFFDWETLSCVSYFCFRSNDLGLQAGQ